MSTANVEMPPKCSKCGRALTDIAEHFSGVQNWYWDEESNMMRSHIFTDRTDDPSKYSCYHCGHPLTKEQVEWFEGHKDA